MRLEDLNIENMESVSDNDLKSLKNRAEQLYNSTTQWKNHIKKNQMGLTEPINECEFMKSVTLLYNELHKRRLISKKTPLDVKILKKMVTGIDTQDLPILTVKKDVAYVSGDFVNNPIKTEKVDVIFDKMFTPEITDKVSEIINKETNKEVNVCKSFGNKSIPLYDLVLMPKTEVNTINPPEIEEKHDISINLIKKSTSEEVNFTKNEEQHLVGGIVYSVGSPDDVDGQGDFIDSAEDIFKAMKTWAVDSQFTIKFMHEGTPVEVFPVESFQPDTDIEKGGGIIPAGSWYITCFVADEELWSAIKKGEINAFSMAGSADAEIIEE